MRSVSLKLFLSFILLFLLQSVKSQNVDSLIKALKTAGRDSNKVILLNTLAKHFENSDAKRSLGYINEALLLSENLDYKKGLSNWKIIR